MTVLPAAATPNEADRVIGIAAIDPDQATGPVGADEWFARQRLFPDPTVDLAGNLSRAQGHAKSLQAGHSRAAIQSQAQAAAWQSLGPGLGGRVSDLATDPTRANTIYAGAASGGLWKSTDGGSTFSYSWGPTLPQSVGAVAVAANGTIYVGTGEGNPGSASYSFPGNGVYKSTDGGSTWLSMGLTGTDRIGRISIDPNNSNRLFVAAAGKLYQPGGARGLYRTEDGGTTWQQVLAGANDTTGSIDVSISPDDSNTIYTSMWDHTRTPAGRVYGGVGSGIHKSTDGGATWTRLAGGLPASSSNLGRMGVAVAKSDPNRLYAIAANTPGNFLGFWTSTNKGASWTQVTSSSTLSGSQSTFGWWFGRIFVDPLAAQHIWVPGVPMLESTNAGTSWTSNSSSFHVDQHALAFDPNVANKVYLGNDGGIYRSTQNGSLSGSWTKSGNLANMQFYTVGVSQQDPTRINGGLQDNGSVRSWAGWGSYYGGDGLANVIDPTNHLKVYACSQNGSCGRSTNGGNSMSAFGAATSDRWNWLSPVALDPTTPSTVYFAGNRVNRSTNSAAGFSVISPNLAVTSWGTVSAIGVAKSNAAVIYAGTDDGKLWVTRNTGSTWTDITAGLPSRYMTRVTVDPTDANLAYITVSGYRNGSSAAQVFRTTNGGSTYQAISGNLPDAPVNDIVLDPQNRNILYVGTDVGAFTSTNGGANWSPVGTGMPLVPVTDLEPSVSAGQTVLTAATYGLGIYQIRPAGTPSNDFSLSASPASATVIQGSSATTTVSTAVVSGTAESVSFSATGLPAGATASFNPTSVTAGGSTTATVATSASTPAGTYSVTITGTAASAVRSTTFTLTVAIAGGCAGTNGTDVAIPDNTTVTSTIVISGCSGNASATSTAEVHIRHTYIGDLVVSLVAPDGTAYVLHNRTGSSTDNIDKVYTVNLSSEVRDGTWTLRVQDAAAQDVGTIDTWTLTL
ncbi:Glycosyl hydrolase, BNR repeat precursor [Alloactinosynnema sp. L-07]|uniref:proprotein convertase P-domain-containing protein n=1 Tax=Alloactinosynnema sp. L-07 TaxID=1653480 RepID=UPI00065EF58A|nr:proprotein convertase P-domain-containing protein [Alloactinosynnema sp. L-07]CRK56082.1 Glycosyl hydrolase, BNR repeat precursor [Alloactinosynnema sp. L-07]